MKWVGAIITAVVLVALFLIVSYLAQTRIEPIIAFLGGTHPAISLFIYFVIAVSSVVVAPLVSFPLLPIVANIWGVFAAGVVTLAAWTIGSVIAFQIARKYGRRVVLLFTTEEQLQTVETYVPDTTKNIFWSILILRMTIPVDALSYALGLLSPIRLGVYTTATIIGMTPGVIIFAYLGTIPIRLQLGIFVIGGAVLFFILTNLKKYSRRVAK